MGTLLNDKLGKRIVLEAVSTVGRSDRSTLRLADDRVSLDHASIRWEGEGWSVRDLGSLNRTFVDGQPLSAGESKALYSGARLAFGRDNDSWLMADARAPRVAAVPLEGGPVLEEEDGLLPLPSVENPVVTLCRTSDGSWELEPAAGSHGIADQSVIDVLGARYRICIPHVAPRTTPIVALSGACISELFVEFRVSSDLDDVELVVKRGPNEERLQARSHFELLRVLARARRKDIDEGLPEPNCGWVHIEDLSNQVKLDVEHVHVQIYRIRQQFSLLGLVDPGRIIERRGRSRLVRFGARDFAERGL